MVRDALRFCANGSSFVMNAASRRLLLAIFNKCFQVELRNYSTFQDGHIYREFKVLDYWIDMAIDRGWMSEDEREPTAWRE